MNTAVKILLTIVLVLLLLFCTIAIIGAFSLDPGEEIIVGRLIAVIAGEIIAVAGLVAIWRKKAPAA